MIDWLFEIGALKLSTKDTTYGGNSYAGAIIADSFSGITMRWDLSGSGLIAANALKFDVIKDYAVNQFEGEFCTVRLIVDDVQEAVWKFKIKSAIAWYGKISCSCVDFLHDVLDGDYPNTKNPKEIWPSDDAIGEDNYCVPVVLGNAFIPVRSVNTGIERYYILGVDGTYTVSEVQSPRKWPNKSTWDGGSYTMSQSTSGGYRLLQPKIDERVSPPGTGLWSTGTGFMDMLCRYTNSATAAITNPADWIEYVLEDYGVASGDIDAATFGTAGTSYATDSIQFHGGWWEKENRERNLASLLAHVDSLLVCCDAVQLHRFSTTSQLTVDNVLLKSFRPERLSKNANDSGRVHWPESETKPQDVLVGQTIVPAYAGGPTATPSKNIFEARFLAGQSVAAQKAGILYWQKRIDQHSRYSFSISRSALADYTLRPGHVITLANTDYGGTFDVIVTELRMKANLEINISCVKLNHMEDWDDLAPAAISVTSDTSDGFPSAEDGEDAVNIVLSNPAHVLPTTNTGEVTYTNSGTDIRVWKGNTVLDYGTGNNEFSVTASGTNVTPGSASTPTTYIRRYGACSSMTQNTAYIEFTVTVKDDYGTAAVFAIRQSLSKSIQGSDGADGADGTSGADGIDLTNWNSTVVFSSSSRTVVAWSSGTIYTPGGASQAISSGSVSSLTTTTRYIYFDGTSTFKVTTTASTAVGTGKILVAVVRAGATGTTQAVIHSFGGQGGMLVGANEIAAQCITATQLNSSLIYAGTIKNSAENLIIDFSSASIRVNSAGGLKIDSAEGITMTSPGSLKFVDTGGFNGGILSPYGTQGVRLSAERDVTIESGTHYTGSRLRVDAKSGAVDIFGQSGIWCNDVLVPGAGGINLGHSSYYWDTLYAMSFKVGAGDELDKYEEGTYIPTLTCGSGSITLNTSYRTLAYTIIGNKVTVTGRLDISSVSSPGGTLTISLPVSIASLTQRSGYFNGSMEARVINANTDPVPYYVSGSTGSTVSVLKPETTGGSTQTAADFKAGSSITVGFSYFT